jgi:excisionase family DNA binding protein
MNEIDLKPRRRLASVNQAMVYVGCGRTRLYELINCGAIIAVRLGGRTRVDLDSVDKYHRNLPRIGSGAP